MFLDLSLPEIKEKLKCELSVVIPVYNESLHIIQVLEEWKIIFNKLKIDYLFILINDGSKDDSLKIIQNQNFKSVVINKRNSGHGRSVRLGYDFSLTHTTSNYILQIDSDGQCRPNHFDKFWNEKNNYDFILGKRVNRGDGIVRKLTSKISSYLSSIILGSNLNDPNTPYRLISREILEKSLKYIPESFDIHNIALTYSIKKNKGSIKRLDISFPMRMGGENSINLTSVAQMGISMLFGLYLLKKKNKW